MSYKINKTDGTLLVDLVDGRIDVDTTDLTLIGRNYTGYGERFNENFIKLLENFSNSAAPANPLEGQLWYDTSEGRLKIFNGTVFRSTDTTVVSATQPELLAGDIWIDSATQQIKFSDGNNVILAGPIYTFAQGVTGFDVQTVVDRFGVPRTVARLMIGGAPVALISSIDFISAQNIANFGTNIQAGVNISSAYPNFRFLGTAESASSLIDSLGDEFTPDDFLKIAANNTATGSLHVKNDNGIIIGDDSDYIIKVEGISTVNRAQLNGADVKFQINQSSVIVDYFTVDNSTSRIGVWQSNPQFGFDINTDVRIAGNLQVDGTTSYFDVTNLRVEDKTIELAITSDSVLLPESSLDGAGIIVKATGNDKSITWNLTYDTWDSSTHWNVPTGYAYKVGYNTVLTETGLGSSVVSSSLTSVGTLTSLNVDNINLNNATITTTTNPLIITSAGDISITGSRKIYGVGSPDISDSPDYVATKGYVDDKTLEEPVYLSLDITGLSNSQIALVINDLAPSITKNIGVYAYVHCVQYSGSIVYNASDAISKSFVAVDKNGTENQSVLADVSFSNVTETVSLSVSRSLKRFVINGSGNWAYDIDLVSSV